MALMDLVKELRGCANAIEKMIELGHAFDRHLDDSMVLSFAKTLSQNQGLQDALVAAFRAGIKIVVSAGGYDFLPSYRVDGTEPPSRTIIIMDYQRPAEWLAERINNCIEKPPKLLTK